MSCGGFNARNQFVKDCYSFNVANKRWVRTSPMTEPRYDHGVFQLSDNEFLTLGEQEERQKMNRKRGIVQYPSVFRGF